MTTKNIWFAALPALCLLVWWLLLRPPHLQNLPQTTPAAPALPTPQAPPAEKPAQDSAKNPPATPKPPKLQATDGDNQTGNPGAWIFRPLVVRVMDGDGNPVPEAPVLFTVSGTDGGQVATPEQLGLGQSITLKADHHGQAVAFFKLPPAPGVTSHITASYGVATEHFTETTNHGAPGGETKPDGGITTVLNNDGSLDVSWTKIDYNNPTTIDIRMANGTLERHIAPPGAHTLHIPP